MSWYSKTTSQSMCWHMLLLTKLQKPLLNFYIRVTSLSFWALAQLLSDRGANFMSSVIEEMCKILGVKKLQTMPYHPQTNGVGREIATDNNANDQDAGRRPKANWPSHLAEIAHAYNATHSTVTGYSLHYLMFG